MKIAGGRLIFWGGVAIVVGGVATMAVNSILYSNLEEYRKSNDYRIWSQLIRKAASQDVCEDKLGGEWKNGRCGETKEPKDERMLILPNKLLKVPENKECSDVGGYQRTNTDSCIEPGTIFMSKLEFGGYEEVGIDHKNVIFDGSHNIRHLLKTGAVGKDIAPYEVKARMYSRGEKYVVVFEPQTFEGEKEYLFPKPLKGVAVDHLCSRLDNTSIFTIPNEEKRKIKRIGKKKVFLLNGKNNNMWSCGWEKHVRVVS